MPLRCSNSGPMCSVSFLNFHCLVLWHKITFPDLFARQLYLIIGKEEYRSSVSYRIFDDITLIPWYRPWTFLSC